MDGAGRGDREAASRRRKKGGEREEKGIIGVRQSYAVGWHPGLGGRGTGLGGGGQGPCPGNSSSLTLKLKYFFALSLLLGVKKHILLYLPFSLDFLIFRFLG
jgi:hypothetical protein